MIGYDPCKPYKAQIKKLISETWETRHVSVRDVGAAYPIMAKHFDEQEVLHTDGIGTKGVQHWRFKTYKEAVQDALAMNLNDLAMLAAVPYAMQDHLMIPNDDRRAIKEIIEQLALACKEREIALTGGETSIQNNLVGMELSLTVAAIVVRAARNLSQPGDVILGFKSSGLHSNGFTLATTMLPDNWEECLTCPTLIYHGQVLDICEKHTINALMHIAGGAWTRLLDILPNDTFADVEMPYHVPDIFNELHDLRIGDETMYKTFNCGIGFILTCDPGTAELILEDNNELVEIGTIVAGPKKVVVKSSFTGKMVEFHEIMS